MEGTIKDGFLNGMEFSEFIVLYIWALLGALLSFLNTADDQKRSPTSGTPNKWSWPVFWKGFIKRFLTTVILMAVVIIYWDEISSFIFLSESPIELKGWSAFILIGVGFDLITEKIFGKGKAVIYKIAPKLNGNSH